MYSVKPGRGPSAAGIFMGMVAALFGVIFTATAWSMGAPPFFTFFGIIFIVVALGSAAFHGYNAFARHRMSVYDITGPGQEPDPLDPSRRSPRSSPIRPPLPGEHRPAFCSNCGAKLDEDDNFCSSCGMAAQT